ncbi:MAG: 50S ribosomal protein L29 [Deltaproteobacteria bacterium]|nr:50S ribosomal protein L29 [Deltaproteobacteria bacterium]
MKASDVREKTPQELRRLATDLAEELFRLRMRHAMGQLEKTANVRRVRKDIARVKTALRAKSVG